MSALPPMKPFRLCVVLGLSGLLAGCANFSPDGGLSAVKDAARADLGKEIVKVSTDAEQADAGARTRALLKKGLTADRAVQVALLNNKGLQAAFNELGISEAQFVAASLPPNPSISILDIRGGGQFDIERRLVANLLSLLTLSARKDIAATQFQGAQLRAVAAVLKLAADTRRQYWRAVAAREQEGYLVQARGAAEATSELAKRLGETGAMNKLDQGREHAFYAELSAQGAKAKVQQSLERERLTRLMGLWGRDASYAVPSRLPSLPGRLKSPASIEREAIERRIDIKMARGGLDLVAKQYGLTQATRHINALQIGGAQNVTRSRSVDPATGVANIDKANLRGAELTLEIPIFDFGEARLREAEQTYMRAVNLLAERAVVARSEAREAYLAYKGSWDVARVYQSQVLPLRKAIQDESLLQYNGMLADLFTLINDARARTLSNVAAIDARRDFWIAEADLQAALIGGGMGGGEAKVATSGAPGAAE